MSKGFDATALVMAFLMARYGGTAGKSAYDYAVEGGYTGSEEAFSERLALLLNSALIGLVDGNRRILLYGGLEEGVYTAFYEMEEADGSKTLVEIGPLVVGSEEPAPVTYSVTFMADGAVVAVVDYAAGDSTIPEPAVPHKEGYTGAWEAYDLSLGGDITVHALYTETVVEPAFVNLIDEAGYTMGKRISNSGGGETTATKTIVLTGPLPVENYGDVFHVRGVDSLTPPSDGTGDYAGKFSCWDSNKGFIAGTLKSFPASCVGTDANGDLTLTYTSDWGAAAGTAYIRLQFYDADGSVPSLIVSRNRLIPKS